MSDGKEQPLVSIVIPTYNHACELKKALQSVIEQSFTDWEAWVINNYSDDNTTEVIDSFNDARIHRVDFHNYGNIASSRNEGVRRSRGNLIAFLDSDDRWMPEKLELACDVFKENPNVDLVCHWENICKHDEVIGVYKYGPEEQASYRRLLFGNNQLSTSAVIVKRELLERVNGFTEDPVMVTAEDYDLWLKLVRSRCRVYFLKKVLGQWTITNKNMSARIDIHSSAVREVIKRHYNSLSPKYMTDPILFRCRCANIDCGTAWAYFRSGNKKQAFKGISAALIRWPFSLRMWFAVFRFVVGF